MAQQTHSLQPIYDASGVLVGVFVPLAVWKKVADLVEKRVAADLEQEAEKPEPLADWEMLKKFWDFRYPVDTDVTCGECQATTEDWMQDKPRKFKLRAANLGGLVTFQCLQCKAKIIKRHFKDHIAVETKPHSG